MDTPLFSLVMLAVVPAPRRLCRPDVFWYPYCSKRPKSLLHKSSRCPGVTWLARRTCSAEQVMTQNVTKDYGDIRGDNPLPRPGMLVLRLLLASFCASGEAKRHREKVVEFRITPLDTENVDRFHQSAYFSANLRFTSHHYKPTLEVRKTLET